MSRKSAREIALKLIYARQFGSTDDYGSILALQAEDTPPQRNEKDAVFALELADGVESRQDEIDACIERNLRDWRIGNMALVDLCILRLAVYELLYRKDSPPNVYINEAIELAKIYAGEKSATFVNGVLGGVMRESEGGAPDEGEMD